MNNPVVVFLTAFSTRVSVLSCKIHSGDYTPKDNVMNPYKNVKYVVIGGLYIISACM